ncbi:hypothetical protein [Streptomyces sp. NPDC056549]|uniref:hypothetical protein n=1 Tax=Streptomyces sp. NPDC056549 TaxID=3345864 RepID=UPI0036BBC00D
MDVNGGVDLRRVPVEEALARAEHMLGVELDRQAAVRKRRTVGARTGRGTWVRIERRGLARARAQGWHGVETAAALDGVAMPAWRQGCTWWEPGGGAVWRADETELVVDGPVGGPVLLDDPWLSEAWWQGLNRSLDALAGAATTRVASPGTMPITRERVARVIGSAFPTMAGVDVDEWRPAHGDLSWANVTSPRFYLIDWEDWGLAPRGFDAAYLWVASLPLAALAERVWTERRHDLESRSGLISALFVCGEVLAYADETNVLLAPVQREAERLVAALG